MLIAPDAEDPPEPLTDGAVDAGEAIAEQLALELDPFPRAPGAVFKGFSSPREGDDRSGGPFAALARLRAKPQ